MDVDAVFKRVYLNAVRTPAKDKPPKDMKKKITAKKVQVAFHLRFPREENMGKLLPITKAEFMSLPTSYFPVVLQACPTDGRSPTICTLSGRPAPSSFFIQPSDKLYVTPYPTPPQTEKSPLELFILESEEYAAATDMKADNALLLGAFEGYNFAVRQLQREEERGQTSVRQVKQLRVPGWLWPLQDDRET